MNFVEESYFNFFAPVASEIVIELLDDINPSLFIPLLAIILYFASFLLLHQSYNKYNVINNWITNIIISTIIIFCFNVVIIINIIICNIKTVNISNISNISIILITY